jgi:pimeloyl-ACP methyl ester carboxylesterase
LPAVDFPGSQLIFPVPLWSLNDQVELGLEVGRKRKVTIWWQSRRAPMLRWLAIVLFLLTPGTPVHITQGASSLPHLSSGASPPDPMPAPQVLGCGISSSGGYELTVDTDHSSDQSNPVICNYVVKNPSLDGAVSGMAVTVQYMCKADIQDAWTSKTGARDQAYPDENGRGEILRSPSQLITREDRNIEGFAGSFTVQLKMFQLGVDYIATVVVLTDVAQPRDPNSTPDPLKLNLDISNIAGVSEQIFQKNFHFVSEINCGGLCPTVVDPAGAVAPKVHSTPKDSEAYTLQSTFSEGGGKKITETFDKLNGSGTVVLAVAWLDRNRTRKIQCFEQPLSDVYGLTDSRIQGAIQNGDWTFRRPVASEFSVPLDLRYGVLDQLEAIVRDPNNAQQTLKDGEVLLRGAALDFDTQIFIYDLNGLIVAKSNSATNASFTYEIRYPVVFVPGTAGSRLLSGGNEVWPQPVGSGGYGLTSAWAPMRLDENGNGPEVTVGDVFRCYAVCFIGHVYQYWLDHMKANGYEEGRNLLLFPYDWRLDITKHPANLDQAVDQALELNYNRKTGAYTRQPQDQVVMITHSQGGLVARAYTADQAHADKVAYLIQTAPTNYGSLKALKAAGMMGYSFETPFLDPQVGKWMARNYGAAYFQFPISTSGSGEIDQFLFDEQKNPIPDTQAVLNALRTFTFCDHSLRNYGSPVPLIEACTVATMNPNVMTDAVNFHKNLPSPPDRGVPTYVIAGTDQPTIVGYRRDLMHQWVLKSQLARALGGAMPANGFTGSIPKAVLMKVGVLPPDVLEQEQYKIVSRQDLLAADDVQYTFELRYYAEVFAICGDNLVPLHRAVDLPGVEKIYVKGVTHGGMTEDPTVQLLIDRLLGGVHPVGIDPPVCSSQPAPITIGDSITVQNSPANLHVYDSQERHTGIKADGTIEVGIPGSNFEARGGTQQVVLSPTSEQLRISLEGLIDTTFNVRIVSGDGTSEKQVEYLAVPETPSSRGEIKYSSSDLGESTQLAVDTDNDGQVDLTLKPWSVTALQGGQSPTPGVSAAQPNTAVSALTIQAAQRGVIAGDVVLIPVWLIKGAGVANLNVEVRYDAAVAIPEGTIGKGNLLDHALFAPNPNESGVILAGFAQTGGLTEETGTVMNVPFRAVGQPGDRTHLEITVTTINDATGAALTVDRISGEILIVSPDGTVPGAAGAGGSGPNAGGLARGDCDGDGQVTEADALCALEMSVQLLPPQPLLDVDDSNDVTSRDAAIILQRAIGK